jgi:hypothetical protein
MPSLWRALGPASRPGACLLQNSDYRFSVTIPDGAIGWGAGLGAPFHGFIVYLGEDVRRPSCIDLKIGLRLDLPEDSQASNSKPVAAKDVKVGNLAGKETQIRGSIDGVSFGNIIVSVELHRGSDIIS